MQPRGRPCFTGSTFTVHPDLPLPGTYLRYVRPDNSLRMQMQLAPAAQDLYASFRTSLATWTE
jgi:hypothetical protein